MKILGAAPSSPYDAIRKLELDARVPQKVTSGSTAPSSPSVGDIWIDTSTDAVAASIATAFKGAWSSSTSYTTGQLASSGGVLWMALTGTTVGVTPAEGSQWTRFAAA